MEDQKFSFLSGEFEPNTTVVPNSPSENPDSTPEEKTAGENPADDHESKLAQKREEKEKKSKEDSPLEKREVVMHGAELNCPYAQGPGKLVVTSNELLLQTSGRKYRNSFLA